MLSVYKVFCLYKLLLPFHSFTVRYKIAFGLQGITDKMRVITDKKFLETQNRSRLLNSKLNPFKEKAPKSADYRRDMSKTSDYGSLSDASGSPMT